MNGKTYLTWVAALTAAFVLSISSPAAQKESAANKSTTATTSSSSSSKSKKVNLNTASKSELQSLPGVGPSIADSIIAARPFKSVDDLKKVSGIGDQRFQEIRPLVTASSGSAKKSGASGSSASASTGQASGSGKPGAEAKSKSNVPPGSKSESATRSSTSSSSSSRSDNSSTRASTSAKVNLNTASLEELEALPGIGPVKAQAIIDARPFKSTEDVMKVNGIKEGIYGQIRDQITVR